MVLKMKKLSIITILFFFILQNSFATDHYFNSSTGNDAAAGTIGAPWLSIAKFNSVAKPAGDRFLFEGTFYGAMVVNASGTSGNPITITSYGTGATITGFTIPLTFTNLGGNIWESSSAISTLSACNMVVINGRNIPMGRYPNTGWLTYQSASGNTSITSSSLTGTPNWTGAEAVIRKYTWIIDRGFITSQTGGTLNYTAGTTYNGIANSGFFIQNDIRTLDQQNEWYYNPSTKKIDVYSTSMPTNVQVTSIDNLINVTSTASNIVLNNLNITGANTNCILIDGGTTVTNCDIDFSGNSGITTPSGTFAQNFFIDNNTINHCNNNSISYYGNLGINITNNVVKNNGMIVGASQPQDGSCLAITTSSANPAINISYNNVDSSGYVGIDFKTGYVTRNYITNFCYIKQDGGAIYTSTGDKNTFIDSNIVNGGHGDQSGMAPGAAPHLVCGIYIDYMSEKATAMYNTISDIVGSAFHFNDPDSLTLKYNTTFNISDAAFSVGVLTRPYKGANYKNNIFCVSDSSQSSAYFTSAITNTDLTAMGSIDSNYLVMANSSKVSLTELFNPSYSYLYYNFSYWNNTNHNDIHSSLRVISMDSLRLETNPSVSPKTINLGANYIDVKGNNYNGSITLAPYTSVVLIRTAEANIPPVANAGTNTTIILPANTVSLSGSGTDADGTVTNYLWTQISGPSSYNIVNASSPVTDVTGLEQGVYQFKLTVTDNNGATGADTATLTILQKQPILRWLPLQNAPFGTLYGTQQETATADVPGTYTYSFTVGTQIPFGITVIIATFHPTDTVNYSGGTVSTTIQTFAANPFSNYWLINLYLNKIQ